MSDFFDAALAVPFPIYALIVATGIGAWLAYLAIPKEER